MTALYNYLRGTGAAEVHQLVVSTYVMFATKLVASLFYRRSAIDNRVTSVALSLVVPRARLSWLSARV